MYFRKKMYAYATLLFLMYCTLSLFAKNAIVQSSTGERLGDRLLYISAVKYFALLYDLDFFYINSSLMDQFTFSITDIPISKKIESQYKNKAKFNEATYNKANSSTLFKAQWGVINNFYKNFGKRHAHRDIFDQLQQLLKPLGTIPTLNIPHGYISVAVHIRKGDGYDQPLQSQQIYRSHARRISADRSWPKKFPPEQYYINQINLLAELLAEQQLIFYIFSDSHDPNKLTQRIASYCKHKNANFINASSSLQDSPIFDMCKMASCDCLIRPESSYSMVAQIMGNHKIVLFPQKAEWKDNILYIPEVNVILFNSIKNNTMQCVVQKCDSQILRQWLDELF